MSYFYGLLAVAGWVWLVIVGAILLVKLRRSDGGPSESLRVDVAHGTARDTDAKQH